MSTLCAYVDGVGVIGPGIADWPAACAILRGERDRLAAATELPVPVALPPAERRRTGRVVRLALAVGFAAAEQAALALDSCVTVFASSGGDGDNCHEICQVLASADRQLSPTRFHNSVHNAPAGYWSIASGSRAASTALCAFDASFAAGLLEATVQLATTGARVLLMAYDLDYPPPLRAKRAISAPFGVALALAATRGPRSLARLAVGLGDQQATRLPDARLEALRTTVPAARSLPLLARLARREAGAVALEYLAPGTLAVEVEPC